MQAILRNFKNQAKDLIKRSDEDAKNQQKLLMAKLLKMGLIEQEIEVEKILDIPMDDLFNRRLQSVVFKQGLAHSMKQARQFIVHGHITVNNKVLDVPSYIVKKGEEELIGFKETSPLQDEEHPERVTEAKKELEEITVKPKEEKGEEVKAEEPKVAVPTEEKVEAKPEVAAPVEQKVEEVKV
jgi:small subunit ribosomal protein S4